MLWNVRYTPEQMKDFLSRAETTEEYDAPYRVGECYWWGTGGVTAVNQAEAFRWWRLAAEKGSGKARWWLGFGYKLGSGGLERNKEQAQLWFRQAVELLRKEEKKDAEAKYMLGECYFHGDGVEKDRVVAVKYFREASTQGHGLATLELGVCLEKGRGVDKNLLEAVKTYQQAANMGTGWGTTNLKRLVNELPEKAEDGDDVDSMQALAYCLKRGVGIEKDAEAALEWEQKIQVLQQKKTIAVVETSKSPEAPKPEMKKQKSMKKKLSLMARSLRVFKSKTNKPAQSLSKSAKK